MTDTPQQAALDAAMHEWAASVVDGCVVTGYVVQAAAVTADDMDEQAHYLTFLPDAQPMHVALGLVQMLDGNLRSTE